MPTTHEGIEGLRKLPNYRDIKVVFDATSAGAHIRNNAILQKDGKKVIDLTPAAIGPFTIPVINGDANIDEPNVNMVTCGGQATIPMVYAVKRAAQAGDLRRDRRLDLVEVGRPRHARQHRRVHRDDFERDREARRRGARQGDHHPQPGRAAADHARHGLHAVAGRPQEAIEKSVADMVAAVQKYVPGYRLKQKVQFEHIGDNASGAHSGRRRRARG